LAGLLALATLALYWPAINFSFIDFDDPYYVSANVAIQKGITWQSLSWILSHVVLGNWHPVTMFSHMLDCQLFGLKPWGHHLTSILIHCLNTVLVFKLLRQLTGATWRSFFVAALFGLHPLRIESVAWIAERKDVLSGCFGLLTLIFYAHYAQKQASNPAGRPAGVPLSNFDSRAAVRDYSLAWLFLTLGLMSKSMLVTWPFLMLVLDYWPLDRFKPGNTWRLLREKIPFLIPAALLSIITFHVQKGTGAMGMLELSFGERAENALVSYYNYLEKMFWPVDLAVIYPHPGRWPAMMVLAAGILMVGISTLVWLRRRRQPFLLVGWLWYGGTLVPVIGLVQVGSAAMADRYTYLPSVGVIVLVVWGIYELTSNRRYLSMVASAAGLAGMLLCFGLTRQQLGYWQNSETLFRHSLAVTRSNYLALINLAAGLDEEGRFGEAIDKYQEALRLKPDSFLAHNSLGFDFGNLGNSIDAIRQYEEALRLNPNYAECHNNLGVEFGVKGNTAEAIHHFQEAVRLKPDYTEAHSNLGLALYQNGQIDEAILEFEEALRQKPDFTQAQQGLQRAIAMKNAKSPRLPSHSH
jgi:tetratricopeptide (TPR) repeat protein